MPEAAASAASKVAGVTDDAVTAVIPGIEYAVSAAAALASPGVLDAPVDAAPGLHVGPLRPRTA